MVFRHTSVNLGSSFIQIAVHWVTRLTVLCHILEAPPYTWIQQLTVVIQGIY